MAAAQDPPSLIVPKPGWLYWTLRWCIGLGLKGLKIEIEGLENLPKGKAILAPNHTSNLDPPLVGTQIPEATHFAAKSQMFKPFLGWFLRKGMTHPVRRQGGDPQAIRLFKAILESGQKLVMFAEGTRSRDGQLQPFKSGVATLAVWTGAPIVPIGILGAHSVWPPGQSLPKWHGQVRIRIGKPLVPQGEGKEEIERLTHELETAVRQLIQP